MAVWLGHHQSHYINTTSREGLQLIITTSRGRKNDLTRMEGHKNKKGDFLAKITLFTTYVP